MIYVHQNIYAITFTYIIMYTVYIVLLHNIYYTLWTQSMCCIVCTVDFACVWKENKNDLKIKKKKKKKKEFHPAQNQGRVMLTIVLNILLYIISLFIMFYVGEIGGYLNVNPFVKWDFFQS